jgi:uncharacterized membrane protein YccF (DUF307 family)
VKGNVLVAISILVLECVITRSFWKMANGTLYPHGQEKKSFVSSANNGSINKIGWEKLLTFK